MLQPTKGALAIYAARQVLRFIVSHTSSLLAASSRSYVIRHLPGDLQRPRSMLPARVRGPRPAAHRLHLRREPPAADRVQAIAPFSLAHPPRGLSACGACSQIECGASGCGATHGFVRAFRGRRRRLLRINDLCSIGFWILDSPSQCVSVRISDFLARRDRVAGRRVFALATALSGYLFGASPRCYIFMSRASLEF